MHKGEAKAVQPNGILWRDRQLRDYRNGLCYNCGEKFEPGHNEVCSKKAKPHANALVLNDLDRELSDDVLNQLAIEDALPDQFGQLSLNAISSSDHSNCIKLKTKVKDKVMLVLVDSGSSHSFISSILSRWQAFQMSTCQPEKLNWQMGNGWLPTSWCLTYNGIAKGTP